MFASAYATIVILTCYLIAMNVLGAVKQYVKDRNEVRLYSFLTTLVIAGSLIIGLSGMIVQKVYDSRELILSEMAIPQALQRIK